MQTTYIYMYKYPLGFAFVQHGIHTMIIIFYSTSCFTKVDFGYKMYCMHAISLQNITIRCPSPNVGYNTDIDEGFTLQS